MRKKMKWLTYLVNTYVAQGIFWNATEECQQRYLRVGIYLANDRTRECELLLSPEEGRELAASLLRQAERVDHYNAKYPL